jgi:hypothetical protein
MNEPSSNCSDYEELTLLLAHDELPLLEPSIVDVDVPEA